MAPVKLTPAWAGGRRAEAIRSLIPRTALAQASRGCEHPRVQKLAVTPRFLHSTDRSVGPIPAEDSCPTGYSIVRRQADSNAQRKPDRRVRVPARSLVRL